MTKAKGRLHGKQPKLEPNQGKHLLELYDLGTYSVSELAELFGVGRSTIYRTIERLRPIRPDPERPFAHLESQRAATTTLIRLSASDVMARSGGLELPPALELAPPTEDRSAGWGGGGRQSVELARILSRPALSTLHG